MKISDKIKTVCISSLVPYDNNAKKHSPEQIEKIKKSISKNSYLQPIVIDKKNTIIIGHGRYEALKQLNGDEQQIEVVCIDYLTDGEIRALRILDNKLNESEWIEENLDFEIGELKIELSDEEIEEMTGVKVKKKELNDLSNDFENNYEIIIECDSEIHQQSVYDQIKDKYKCRLSTF